MSNRGIGRTTLGLLLTVLCVVPAPASAQAQRGLRLCVPKGEGRGILTPVKGVCKRGFALRELGAEGKPGIPGTPGVEGRAGAEGKPGLDGHAGTEGASPFSTEELTLLKSLIAHIKFVSAGVDGQPTITFSGVNVQILNGEGATEIANGTGNLIIGYDEEPGAQTGSHNLVLGFRQRYTSFGDILGGLANKGNGPFSTVFGAENTVSAPGSSVTGGYQNAASNSEATVSGGSGNVASGAFSSVSGGSEGTAEGESAVVAGGFHNLAGGGSAVVSGGVNGKAEGERASVGGGLSNIASGPFSSILGGTEHTVSTEFGHFP